ncbi:Hpt domain-containing protein [Nitratidesulfovibrio vulgaris]|jgi:HPt (histidine-containing phosphotransfer) domain-containing protein|uniref:Hpt domain protein n=2 Tax=Nitratidesulfovibrio vulgaris TaxID=881 RepID=Q72C64_NITV2|nr:Hpt domain-containing protein [Nitratidesulfovibrio vulgaris]AAS95898.1 Hpt domain protein [Nitratidesulfovibrio vulgaris str. Hildenborough]ABM28673.1 Hpt protein [Nitratidesulfovibrio vulgaris DP4]ADP87018.1 Hpt domain protein [Nitratidesulfovibrio vulgaris RCH1]HBW15851.1 Hpt domain-containing protein [Desulfovibrio sp.]
MATLDVQVVLDRLHGDRAFLGELYETFLEDFERRMSRMTADFSSGDREALARQAHSLKGAAATIGATDLHLAAASLDALCRNRQEDEIPGQWGKVVHAAQDARDAMLAWLAEERAAAGSPANS